MKYLILIALLIPLMLLGCGDREPDTSMPEAAAAAETEQVEITAEEEALLEAAEVDTTAEEPVTEENYEDALEELEESIESDQ
jgi:hypothetical protein